MRFGCYNRSHEATKPRYNYALIDAEILNAETNVLMFGRMFLNVRAIFYVGKETLSWSKSCCVVWCW